MIDQHDQLFSFVNQSICLSLPLETCEIASIATNTIVLRFIIHSTHMMTHCCLLQEE